MGLFDFFKRSSKAQESKRKLTDVEGRAFLGLPDGYELPSNDELIQDARAAAHTTIILHRELSPEGIDISPIWESDKTGAVVRATKVPSEFQARYFIGNGLATLSKAGVLKMVGELVPWFEDDPAGAASVLEDTHRVWFSEGAPTRPLRAPYKGHFKLLSLLLADAARKNDAGFDTLEWMASLGLPMEEFREDTDPPVDVIKAGMRQRMQEMWAQEEAWFKKALASG